MDHNAIVLADEVKSGRAMVTKTGARHGMLAMRTGDVVRYLADVLGYELLAYITGKSTKTVRRWADGTTAPKLGRGYRLHRSLRAHRHEGRRLEIAVGRRDHSQASATVSGRCTITEAAPPCRSMNIASPYE